MTELKLYDYPASGNCYKVRLLLAHLGRDYERVPIDIFDGDTLTPEYGARNPVRQTPVLELPGGEAIYESGAILWYLAEGTPFLADSPLGRAQTVQWLSFEQERVMNGIGGARFRVLTGRDAPDSPRMAARRKLGAEALDVLEAELAARPFLVEDRYSIADVAVHGYAHLAEEAGIDLAERPAFRAWLERVAGQPGYIEDLAPYPDNARAGAGRSIYG
jgi:glutathione S-transferase